MMRKSRGLCRAADADTGECRLTRERCEGWHVCRKYEEIMDKWNEILNATQVVKSMPIFTGDKGGGGHC